MPGLLNNIFGDDGGSGEQNRSAQDYDAGVHGGLDLSPTVGVSHHAEANWQDADGTDHSYESDTDVVFTADASAAFAVLGSVDQTSSDAG